MNRKEHWDEVYRTKQSAELSWYQAEPTRSLQLIVQAGAGLETTIIDVGGGDSMLVDALVARQLGHITVLDISGAALARAKARLGQIAGTVRWIEGDITQVELPPQAYDIWHDRAVFHFLTDHADRQRYIATASHAIRPGGTLIVATFALDGPPRCSGLDVTRYSSEMLAKTFGVDFILLESVSEIHRMPSGMEQRFVYCVLRRQ